MTYSVRSKLYQLRTLGQAIRASRQKKGLLLREVAAQLQVDPSLLSKIERGEKKATREQVIHLAKFLNVTEKGLLLVFLSEKVFLEIENEEFAVEVLRAAEEMINYKKGK